ncbi:MAG: hypothetical protein UU47_C0001G0046 [candidate division TM6 bacterium GW2011_GWE2_41_16]|nr:MAG: hypothetical protein UU47_C0001G0046 [candidate division TM6 bacterium GW2011_GWE2_41_16]
MDTYRTLGSLVNSLVDDNKFPWERRLFTRWNTIVGSLSSHMCCEKVERGIVYAGVYDYCLMHELFYLRPNIVASIKKACPDADICDIRFRLIAADSVIHKKKKTIQKEIAHLVKPFEMPILNQQEQHALNAITDVELQGYMKIFFARCMSH